MAWKLRQFFEGDKTLTVSEVADTGVCWVDGDDNYIPDSIILKLNNVEFALEEVELTAGFLIIQLPTNLFIDATTTIQVFADCEDVPESKTLTLTAKPVNFQVYNGVIKACSPQVILNSDIDEYIRLYLTDTSGDYFNAKINNANLSLAAFSYQSGDSGNIAVTNGTFSRPSTFGSNASLISNSVYGESPILTISPLSTKYFTTRLGYIEVIFNAGALLYNNYMVASEFEESMGNYVVGDVITIEATPSQYIVKKNGTVLITKNKNISYGVSGGTISPVSSQVGVPVVWNVPNSAGTYTFTAMLGDSIVFQKSVKLHSCADAVDDGFTAVYNTPFSGNVSTNDVGCVGENTYFTLVSDSVTGGTVVFNVNGTFTFTPTVNFNGNAQFQYNIQCGANQGDSEIVDTATVSINYYNICNGVTANWQPNSVVRCQNCVNERQEIDLNAQCTGNEPRWVANPGGSACSALPTLVDTGQFRCQNCINEKEVQDLNTCSPTYLTKTWVFNVNGTQCDTTPNWVNNGVFRCESCIEQRQQIDNKPCSNTYNNLRWIANPEGTACNKLADWTDLNEFVCVNCVENKKQINNNPCSPTYQQVRNVVNPGGTVCNTNSVWEDTGATRCTNGVHEKEQTSTNQCSIEQRRWIETGLQLCGCITQVKFNDKCFDDAIIGVVVNKRNTVESNRLVSYSNGVITFNTDAGVYDYIITLTRQSGMTAQMRFSNYKCNPVV